MATSFSGSFANWNRTFCDGAWDWVDEVIDAPVRWAMGSHH